MKKEQTAEDRFLMDVYRRDADNPLLVAQNSEYHRLAFVLYEKRQVALKVSKIPGVLEVSKPA